MSNNNRKLAKISRITLITGLGLVLFALICSTCDQTKGFGQFMNNNYFGKLIIILCETIGTTLIVGYAFTIVSSTNSFLNLILQEISRVVMDKKFFDQLDIENRKAFLKKAIITNENDIREKYVGIEKYFNQEIDNCYSFFDQNFRTNYTVSANAFIESNIIKVKSDITYREYKVNKSFEYFFLGYESEMNITDSFTVTDDNNQQIKEINVETFLRSNDEFSKINKEETKLVEDLTVKQIQKYTYPDMIDKSNYVDIQRTSVEEGDSSIMLYELRLLKPCENMIFSLTCPDNIEIKQYATFGDYSGFTITKDDILNKINIITKGWLNPGLGIAILLMKK